MSLAAAATAATPTISPAAEGERAILAQDLLEHGLVEATETVLRTAGFVVEALIGEGKALDDYARGLREQAALAPTLAKGAPLAALDRFRRGGDHRLVGRRRS